MWLNHVFQAKTVALNLLISKVKDRFTHYKNYWMGKKIHLNQKLGYVIIYGT